MEPPNNQKHFFEQFNLSSALGVKTFGLIANDALSELKYSKINFIVPENYKDNTWIRNRENMKTITTQKAYDIISERINKWMLLTLIYHKLIKKNLH